MSQHFCYHRWDYVGSLPEERQWGPAVGLVAGIPVIATGKNYGDGTLEELDSSGNKLMFIHLKHCIVFSKTPAIYRASDNFYFETPYE